MERPHDREYENIMPFSNLLKAAASTCTCRNQKADILSCEHPECRRIFQADWNEMSSLAAATGTAPPVNQTLEEGRKQGIDHAIADGILTQAEETKLKEFHDRPPPTPDSPPLRNPRNQARIHPSETPTPRGRP